MDKLVRVPDYEQGSAEWHQWRKRVLTASNAPIIMGAAPPYWSRRTWDDLADPAPSEHSEWTLRMFRAGHVREQQYGDQHLPSWEHGPVFQRGRFGASLDYARGDRWIDWVEVKSPMSHRSLTWRRAVTVLDGADGEQSHIWWQLVHQAGVLGGSAVTCQLVVTDPVGWDHQVVEVPVPALLEDWPKLKAGWSEWADRYERKQ